MTARNPFTYGGPVSGDRFAGRKNDVKVVVDRLRNHIGIVVTAPRRYGKSSLIKESIDELSKLSPAPAIVQVNLLQVGSMAKASELLLKSLYQVPGGSWHRLKNAIPEFIKKINIDASVSFDESGSPSFSLSQNSLGREPFLGFDDVYAILNEIGENRPAVLYLDEFQAAIDLDINLPGRLKGLADQYPNVSLVLAGSKQHIMESLVISQKAPLYNMLERIALGPIPEDDWIPFLLDRAKNAGRPFDNELTARKVYTLAGPIPFDIQQLAYEAFNQAVKKIEEVAISSALAELIRHRSADYATTFERLSPGSRRVLQALAIGSKGSIASAAFATQTNLAAANSVQRALIPLKNNELVVLRNGKYLVDDPFFAAWLRS